MHLPPYMQLAEDVSSASAAFLWNTLPCITEMDASEAFEFLRTHFEAALTAFIEGLARRIPDPSEN